MVALRKESVDRNEEQTEQESAENESLSARRAWIEISIKKRTPAKPLSLSARRAWIEIADNLPLHAIISVALRKESVDRNNIKRTRHINVQRRSPQGERG